MLRLTAQPHVQTTGRVYTKPTTFTRPITYAKHGGVYGRKATDQRRFYFYRYACPANIHTSKQERAEHRSSGTKLTLRVRSTRCERSSLSSCRAGVFLIASKARTGLGPAAANRTPRMPTSGSWGPTAPPDATSPSLPPPPPPPRPPLAWRSNCFVRGKTAGSRRAPLFVANRQMCGWFASSQCSV